MSSDAKDTVTPANPSADTGDRAVPKLVELAKQAKEVSAAHRARAEGVESSILIEHDRPSRARPPRPGVAAQVAGPDASADADNKQFIMIGAGIALVAVIALFMFSGGQEPTLPQAPEASVETQPVERPKRDSDIVGEAARLAAMAAERARAAEAEAERIRARNAEAERQAALERQRAAAEEAARLREREQALAKAQAQERARLAAELEAARRAEAQRQAQEQAAARAAEAQRQAAAAEAARQAEAARLAAAEEARKAEQARADQQQAQDDAAAARQAENEARAKFLSVKQDETAAANSASSDTTTADSQREANFSTDPCQGPSAKFLSTCR